MAHFGATDYISFTERSVKRIDRSRYLRRKGASEFARGEGGMAKILRCGDLMTGCQHIVKGATEEEVLQQAAKHAKEVHDIKEITPDLAAKVKSKIRTE